VTGLYEWNFSAKQPLTGCGQVGTAVVTRGKDHRLALGRMGALVEQLEALVRSGRQVILVTSGGVSVGRQKLMQQRVLNSSPLEMQIQSDGPASMASTTLPNSESGNGIQSNFDKRDSLEREIAHKGEFFSTLLVSQDKCETFSEIIL
jgi:hypothetical protein